jgi:hypothetical protein
VYTTEAAHNPEVAGSNPAPATEKRPWRQGLLLLGERPGSHFYKRSFTHCDRICAGGATASSILHRRLHSSSPSGPGQRPRVRQLRELVYAGAATDAFYCLDVCHLCGKRRRRVLAADPTSGLSGWWRLWLEHSRAGAHVRTARVAPPLIDVAAPPVAVRGTHPRAGSLQPCFTRVRVAQRSRSFASSRRRRDDGPGLALVASAAKF